MFYVQYHGWTCFTVKMHPPKKTSKKKIKINTLVYNKNWFSKGFKLCIFSLRPTFFDRTDYIRPIGSRNSASFDSSSATESIYQQLQIKVVQVALDIGTTFSGCVFLFTDDYEKGHNRFCCNHWKNGEHSDTHEKTPTCLLLHKDTSVQSFGLNAMNEYSELCMDNIHKDYYFFWNFKKGLHQQTVCCCIYIMSLVFFYFFTTKIIK